MAFDALPPELLMLILELHESTTDLYSIISASPAAFRVFKTASDRILLTVTRRRISPQSLRHAVATISVPEINMNYSERSRFKPLWNFLDGYFSTGTEASEDILLDPGKARALATLHAHVCRHIKRYTNQTCAQLSSPKHGQADEPRQHAINDGQQLSSTERIRLERGFYRYELYCRVFPAEPGNALQSRSSYREQFERFIKRLEPWEMEEIVCVYQYFIHHLGIIIDDLESQLVTRFLSNAYDQEPLIGDRQDLVYYDDLEMRSMTLFSTRGRKDSLHKLGYIAASGLTFMNSVFYATTSTERLDLIRSHGPGTRDLMADALYRGAEELPHPLISRDFSGDDPSLPNLGYLKYAPDVTTIYMQIRENNIRWLPMRLLGYVFWDSNRLEDPLVQSIIEQGQQMSMKELRQRFDRSKQPSAEARLNGFRVRREVMDDLVRDYASTLVLFPDEEVEEGESPGIRDSDGP